MSTTAIGGGDNEPMGLPMIICPTCLVEFHSLVELEMHQHVKSHYKCGACEQNFRDPDALRRHVLQVSKNIPSMVLANYD
jgi:transposase-like protein